MDRQTLQENAEIEHHESIRPTVNRPPRTASDTRNSHPDELKIGAELFRDLKTKTIVGYYTSKEGRVEELGLPEHTMMTTFNGCTHSGDDH